MKIDIQFSPGANDWPVLRDAILRAEADGYDTTWVFDHFDGAMLDGDRPMLECFTLLGALAEATTTIGSGHARGERRQSPPGSACRGRLERAAHERGKADARPGCRHVAGDRMERRTPRPGIPLHADIADRHAAVVEQIRVIRALPDAIPVIVGVNSVRLATLAGQLADGINVRITHERAADFVAAARAAAGHRLFEVSGWTFDEVDDVRFEAEELGLDRLVLTRLGTIE